MRYLLWLSLICRDCGWLHALFAVVAVFAVIILFAVITVVAVVAVVVVIALFT